MPVVNATLLAAMYTNMRTLWNNQFLAAQNSDNLRSKIAMTVNSNTMTESYSWFGTVPKMREWIGERQISQLNGTMYQIRNKDFESTIEVDRNDIEDDQLGHIAPRISQIALEAVRSQEELVVATLVAGISSLGYDGQYFFDTDHVNPGDEYQTAQSNKLTGTGVTLAALAVDFAAAMAAMRNFKDDRGRPMNIVPNLMVVPPALEGVAKQLLNSEQIASDGAANPWRNAVQLEVNGYLTDANDWYLLSTNQPVKPLVFQLRRAPEFNALDNPNNNEHAFMRKQYLYGVDGRWNAGYGFWQLAVLTTNT